MITDLPNMYTNVHLSLEFRASAGGVVPKPPFERKWSGLRDGWHDIAGKEQVIILSISTFHEV